jgi:predicted nucleotidyltransferase
MRTYDAIEKVSQAIIKDGLCEAILVKGSIGRGDDDEFSDVDLYVVVHEDNIQAFLEKRLEYLTQYLPIIYYEYVNFVADQVVAIYEDGLHFDLYTVADSSLSHLDKIKIIYDPMNKYDQYKSEVRKTSEVDLISGFHNVLYGFIEADSAYQRKNYPWVARILSHSVADCAFLLRYLYDEDYAYLGLKKINEVIPKEQFYWLCQASDHLNKEGFRIANEYIIKILNFVADKLDEEVRSKINLRFLEWNKNMLKDKLFQ